MNENLKAFLEELKKEEGRLSSRYNKTKDDYYLGKYSQTLAIINRLTELVDEEED